MKALGIAALALLVSVSAPARASDAPGLINYQGRLLDQGLPANGSFSVTFRIYDDATEIAALPCGNPRSACVWEETQAGVVVGGGVFNVLLGSVNPLTPAIFNEPARWLEIEVAGDVMTPRQRIASSAYALNTGGQINPGVTVAASDSQRPQAADFVADGIDDHLTIQAALDSLPASGGQVLLLQGTFNVGGTIMIRADVSLTGQGPGTNLVAAAGWDPQPGSHEPMLRTVGPGESGGPGAPRTRVSHLKLTSNGDAELYGWHGVNGSFNAWIHHNHFVGFRSGLGAVDASGSNRNLISDNTFDDCAVGYNGTDTNAQFGNIVSNNTFTECTEICMAWAWPYEMIATGNMIRTSQPGAVGIRIDGSYGDIDGGESERGRLVISNNVIKVSGQTTGSHGMVIAVANPSTRLLYGDVKKLMIEGNYISVDHAHAVVFYSRSEFVLMRGNTIDTIADDGSSQAVSAIRVGASYDPEMGAPSSHLDIVGNNLYGGPSDTALEIDNLGHQGIVFKDNHVHGFGTAVRIEPANGGTAALGTRITDNVFTDVALPIENGGDQTVIRDNVGFATESSGLAIVPAGATSVVVLHGLDVTPPITSISVTPSNDLGQAGKFYISDVTATTFTINTDTDPGAATATFVWRIGSDG